MFDGIKKSLKQIENKYDTFNILEKFNDLKVISTKINTLKILYQINTLKNKTLYLGKNYSIKSIKYPRPNYYFRGIGIYCERNNI